MEPLTLGLKDDHWAKVTASAESVRWVNKSYYQKVPTDLASCHSDDGNDIQRESACCKIPNWHRHLTKEPATEHFSHSALLLSHSCAVLIPKQKGRNETSKDGLHFELPWHLQVPSSCQTLLNRHMSDLISRDIHIGLALQFMFHSRFMCCKTLNVHVVSQNNFERQRDKQ